jgi:TonB-linked SusC/RagA family outer membrane protein
MKFSILFFSLWIVSLSAIAQERIIKGIVTDSLTQEPPTDVTATEYGTSQSLKGIVITGYTQERKSRNSGAISTISAAAMAQAPVASFDQALQGRAPGLYVASPSGQPGAPGRVTIRGIGSINGNTNPLYIVDGVPVAPESFAALNQDDFENINILKDAAATAAYGSRAANGVIVITTKKGKAQADGKARINYRTQFGISKVNNGKWDMMNTSERLQFEEQLQDPLFPGWAYSKNNPNKLDNGVLVPKTAADFAEGAHYLDSLSRINTDWRKAILRTALTQSHTLDISGGNENTTFYLSGSYLNQEGVLLNSGLKRYSLRSNVQHTAGRLKTTLNIGISNANVRRIQEEFGITELNPMAAMYYALPYQSPTDAPGPGRFGANALDQFANTSNREDQLKSVMSVNAAFRITDDLQAIGTAGMDFQQCTYTTYLNPASYFGSQVSKGEQGSYGENRETNMGIITNGGLRYNKQWGGKNEIEATLLAEMNRYKFNHAGYTGYGLVPGLPNTPAGITPGTGDNNFIPDITGGRSANLLLSQLALLRYSHGDTYSLSASLRRDGSSRVPQNNRYKYFYAFGGSWNVLSAGFMQEQHTFSMLRLRGSYGLTGNAAGFASDYGFRTLYHPVNYGGAQGIAPYSPGNPAYNWEYNRIADVGLEFGFMNNRIRGELDVYNRITSNLFVDRNLSLTTGFPSIASNAGKIRNRGIELMLEGDIVRQRDLTITLGANMAYNQNRVLSLGDETEIFNDEISISRPGLPLGNFYMVRWQGVDPKTGAPIYLDDNGQPTNTYNPDYAVPVKGSYDPPYKGGATASITYKRFQLSTLFTFIQGMYRLNTGTFYRTAADPNYRQYNQSRDLLHMWQAPGNNSEFQGAAYPRYITSREIQSADYIKWRNLSISYTLPDINALAGQVRSIRVFAQGQNLITWSKWKGFDPEDDNNWSQFEYPMPRIFTAGVNVTF